MKRKAKSAAAQLNAKHEEQLHERQEQVLSQVQCKCERL